MIGGAPVLDGYEVAVVGGSPGSGHEQVEHLAVDGAEVAPSDAAVREGRRGAIGAVGAIATVGAIVTVDTLDSARSSV